MKKIVLAAVIVMLTACASSAPTNFYNLRAQADMSVELQLADTVSLGIGPLRLPTELDRPGIVTETQGSGIDIANYQVWAADLDENFSRVLASLMSTHTGLDTVYAAPWDTRFRPHYQVRVDVRRFSGELGGEVVLEALWTLTGDAGKKVLHTERSELTLESPDSSYQAYVSTLSQLLSQFSVAVSVKLEQLLAAS